MKVLYLCYFGLREPLVETQVLPYLRGMAREGIEVTLLTFEPGGRRAWGEDEERERREGLARDGVRWKLLRYHKKPSIPATLWDVIVGALAAARLRHSEGVDIFHGRSHVAAAMGLIARALAGGGRLVFDIRGLLAEEYADAGHWRRGGVAYRLTRAVERRLLEHGDGFVVLTTRAKEMLFGDRSAQPVEVIPCCIDRERFAPVDGESRHQIRARLGLQRDRFIVVYAGALGGWYLTEEMARFLGVARRLDASVFALVLTQSPRDEMASLLRESGFAESDFRILRATAADVPSWLSASDVGLSLIRTCESKKASSPTKVAEYLAAGLPIVSTPEIGDVDDLVHRERIGVIVEPGDVDSYATGFEAVRSLAHDPEVRARCREVAWREFDLDRVGVARYRRLYRALGV